jgi:epoxyqueuosine reductase QueG
MNDLEELRPWLDQLFAARPESFSYGCCDLSGLLPPALSGFPRAVSFALRMDEALMDSVSLGPTAPYFAEYTRVNLLLNELAAAIGQKIGEAGSAAHPVHSSQKVDLVNLYGEFQHKTAATRAGLGWIGRNCQLITREFGPRVRLCTVLTDCPLAHPPQPANRSYCGSCQACVEVCPVQALAGTLWTPGMARDAIFDAQRCNAWKKANYPQFDGNVCGICTSACPMGTQRAREKKRKDSAA